MDERPPAICEQCMYRKTEFAISDKCMAKGYEYTNRANPDGNCTRFRQRERSPHGLMMWAGVGIGSVLASLLWWVST